MGILDKILRAGEGKKLKALAALVPDINALEPEMKALSDDALRAKTGEFREPLEQGEDLDDLLVEAFAVMREAAQRVIGQRHFDVQLMGGAALHFGWVAEMKTGEGKTLVVDAARPISTASPGAACTSSPSTTTSPPRRRVDGADPPLARAHGRPDHSRLHGAAGREAGRSTRCDITYGTNNEFGFDYLRDNMATSLEEKVQRGHVYAIVDEVDSILIDEARTPLIISGRVADAAKLYYQFASIVRGLKRDDALRGRRGEAHGRSPPRTASRRSSRPSGSRTSTTRCSRTSCTSSRPPSRPRSCTSGTRTTSSSTAR